MVIVILAVVAFFLPTSPPVDAEPDPIQDDPAGAAGSEIVGASGLGLALPPEPEPMADPAQVMLVSDNAQVSAMLMPALRRHFDRVVVGADGLEGQELHPTVGRILVVEATVSNRNDSAYGVQLTNCEARVSAQLLDARTREILHVTSAGSVKKNCELAIAAAATELAGKLTLR